MIPQDQAAPADALKEQLEKASRELAQLQQELEAFTYSIAHDLRAPLRGIVGYLDALREDHVGNLPPPAANYLINAAECATRMQSMLDDLLQISRLGRRDLVQVPLPIGRLVAEVQREVMRDALSRTIEWRIGDLPTVVCDPGLVREVLVALLSNAVKFTRHASRAVIEVRQEMPSGKPAVVVRDNGVGFDPQRAGNLFSPFFRLHNPQEFEGSATSLAKAARIIRRHGGRIWAEAAEGKGAAFYFTLAP